MLSAVAILKIIEIMPVFTHHYHCTLSILPNKTINIIKQNYNQFLLVVKATALEQQLSKFCYFIFTARAMLARSWES